MTTLKCVQQYWSNQLNLWFNCFHASYTLNGISKLTTFHKKLHFSNVVKTVNCLCKILVDGFTSIPQISKRLSNYFFFEWKDERKNIRKANSLNVFSFKYLLTPMKSEWETVSETVYKADLEIAGCGHTAQCCVRLEVPTKLRHQIDMHSPEHWVHFAV